MRSDKNKTIDLTVEQGGEYLDRCLRSGESGENCIILGDCFEALKALPEKSVDLLIADPPYNLDKDFNGNRFRSMSDADYEAYLDSWMGELSRILSKTGTIYVCGDWKSSLAIQRSLLKNFTVLNRITWGREKGRGASANWKNSMEDIWFAVKDPKNYFFDVDAVRLRRRVIAPYKLNGQPKDWSESEDGKFRDTSPSNFWDDISVPFWSMPENTDHPTQKPEKLVAKLVLASSKRGDVVFDPFLGSGTTSVVAKKLGRRFAGIEREPEYACLCEKRLELAESDPSIQGFSDGVFWERNSLKDRIRKK